MGREVALKVVYLSLLMLFMQVLGVVSVAGAGATVRPSKITRQVPAVFVFGDSTMDVGNNNYLAGENVPRANKPYYGIDYPTSRPTGRFSNGYNVADFVAKALGFSESPPAYLSMAPRSNALVVASVSRGVSYASDGAGILDSTHAGENISLSKQVRYFESTRAQVEARHGTRATSEFLSRSLFLFGIGSNDLLVFAESQSQGDDGCRRALRNLISNYSAAITDLYKMGARKFAIINVGPLGCVPVVRYLSGTGGCNDDLIQLTVGLDDCIKPMLTGLSSKLHGLVYSLGNFYDQTMDTFTHPKAFRYNSIDSACCGSGMLGAEGDCLPNSMLCTDRDGFVFWDRVHPSQWAAQLTRPHSTTDRTASPLRSTSNNCSPTRPWIKYC